MSALTQSLGTQLSRDEFIQLSELEAIVAANIDASDKMWEALARIHELGLWRATHGSFPAYCEDKWKISGRQGYRRVQQVLMAIHVTHGSQLPAPTERAARALGAAPEDRQADIWAKAVERNGGEAAPGSLVEKIIAEELPEVRVASSGRRDATADAAPTLADDEEERTAAFMDDFRARKAAREEAPTLERGTAIAGAAPNVEPATAPAKPVRDGDEWFTPPEFIEKARTVLGAIDLDPASCAAAQAVVRAGDYYGLDKGQDGLLMPWEVDTLFLNPPYSNAGAWVERVVAEYRDGNVGGAIVLVNAKTETAWFGLLWEHAVLCFVERRISFVPGDGGESQTGRTGSAFAYLGPEPELFRATFAEVGVIARRWEE